jgi:hypothetical protein
MFMELFVTILLSVSTLAVVVILIAGLWVFAIGGDAHSKHGNRLMKWRVNAQMVAVFFIFLLAAIRDL